MVNGWFLSREKEVLMIQVDERREDKGQHSKWGEGKGNKERDNAMW